MSSFGANLKVGSVYDFRFLTPNQMGSGYDSALVIGIIDHREAQRLADVDAIHRNLRVGNPTLTTTINGLEFVRVLTSANEKRVFAKDWLKTEPKLVQKKTVQFVIPNVEHADITAIKEALISLGFTSFESTIL
jgi:hypothetical protein